MQVFQILYIPTGEYVTSTNRGYTHNSVLFADKSSAQHMVKYLITHKAYISGAPLTDYKIGSMPATQTFYEEEFDYVTTPEAILGHLPQKVLALL